MYDGFGALPRWQQRTAKGSNYTGILLVACGFLLPLLAASEVEPLAERLRQAQERLDQLDAEIAARPTPTPSPTYGAHQPIPVTPADYPITESLPCKSAGPGLIASGGPLCFSESPEKGFLSLTIKVADACTSRGIPNAEVVLKVGRFHLSGTTERAAAVSFLNIPIPKGRSLRGVTIIEAPGYRGTIEVSKYYAESFVGNTELIPKRKVDRPEHCVGVTFFRPRYLRRD